MRAARLCLLYLVASTATVAYTQSQGTSYTNVTQGSVIYPLNSYLRPITLQENVLPLTGTVSSSSGSGSQIDTTALDAALSFDGHSILGTNAYGYTIQRQDANVLTDGYFLLPAEVGLYYSLSFSPLPAGTDTSSFSQYGVSFLGQTNDTSQSQLLFTGTIFATTTQYIQFAFTSAQLNGLSITTATNRFPLIDSPAAFYVDVIGVGTQSALASAVHSLLTAVGTVQSTTLTTAATTAPTTSSSGFAVGDYVILPQAPENMTSFDVSSINSVLGLPSSGDWQSTDTSYTVVYAQNATLLGIPVSFEHGAETRISFFGSSNSGAVSGSTLVSEALLPQVINTLSVSTLRVGSVTNYYTFTQPRYLRVTFIGAGSLNALANSIVSLNSVTGVSAAVGINAAPTTQAPIPSAGEYTTGYVPHTIAPTSATGTR